MNVAEFDKRLKKTGGYIDRNVVEKKKDEDNIQKILNDKNVNLKI